ncbi:MAG: hypothetical protein MOGMAGMI_02248 [Candidatus Omnitrophica bacterium]|nr:hypothetical protein [Candidatus Omnitrophota bacterium]
MQLNLIPRIEFMIQGVLGINRVLRCPYCDTTDTAVIARKYKAIRVRKCRKCSLCFTDPVYKSILPEGLYNSMYEGAGIVTRPPDAATLERMKDDLFSSCGKNYTQQLDILLKLSGSGRRLLELGSSWGYFLYQAGLKGFEAEGVEINDRRRAYGNTHLGTRIRASIVEIPAGSMDAVCAFHMLEHLTSIRTIYSGIAAVLKPGGVFVFEVPNFDPEARGPSDLKSIGAVHPLGYGSEFFRRSLPESGFESVRLFNSYDDLVMDRSVDRCAGGVIIGCARRSTVSPISGS